LTHPRSNYWEVYISAPMLPHEMLTCARKWPRLANIHPSGMGRLIAGLNYL